MARLVCLSFLVGCSLDWSESEGIQAAGGTGGADVSGDPRQSRVGSSAATDADGESTGDGAAVGSETTAPSDGGTVSDSGPCGDGFVADDGGCRDIDECQQADRGGCSTQADCRNVPGGRVCTCNPGFEDVSGDGTQCVDRCELASCDENATCTIVAGEARCECPSPYVGDGETCAFDEACALLECDSHAQCLVSGDSRECRCREGYEPIGQTCQNIDDCVGDPCQHGGSCVDQVGGYDCDCSATGYAGTVCETNIDDCAGSPCAHGLCVDQVLGFACDCTGSGYTGTLCETPLEPEPPPETCLRGGGSYESDGPYGVRTEVVSIGSSGDFTIYAPDPLEAACPHPIVAWGNGTSITDVTVYEAFNRHAASWGIVSIASHNANAGDGTFHVAAIDYLLQANEDPGSAYFGKLSGRVGTAGHSQGGAGAEAAVAMRAAIEAVGNLQGAFGSAPEGVAYLCLTGTEDIATAACRGAVTGTASPALFGSWYGADHLAPAMTGAARDAYVRLYTAWFRCFLADDTDACAMFMGGSGCPVCQEAGWDEIFANNY